MRRYIDANLISYEHHDRLGLGIDYGTTDRSTYEIAYKSQIDKIPTADVEEVRHGKPIVYEVHGRYVTGAAVDETKMPFLVRKEYVEKRERCPFCNATLFGEWGYYCDKCGAKMDKEKER